MTAKDKLVQALEDLAAARSEVTRLEAVVEDLQKSEHDYMLHESHPASSVCSQPSPCLEDQEQRSHSKEGECTLLASNTTTSADGRDGNMEETLNGSHGRVSNPWYKKDKSKIPEKKWRRCA